MDSNEKDKKKVIHLRDLKEGEEVPKGCEVVFTEELPEGDYDIPEFLLHKVE